MKRELVAKYLAMNGAACPYCDSGDLENSLTDYPTTHIMTEVITCQDCGREWIDEYQLVRVYDFK